MTRYLPLTLVFQSREKKTRHEKIKHKPTIIEKVCIKHSLFTKHKKSKQIKAHLPSA